MQNWYRGLLLLGLLLAGIGCSGRVRSSQKPALPLLLFQKTPCYGTCPAYNATFYTDGRVYFEGLAYAPVQDTLTLYLSQRQRQALQHRLQQAAYTSWQRNYPSPYTDMPSSYLTFYEQGREARRIRHQQDGPEALQQLISYLDRLVQDLVQHKAAEK